jgi:hypothetical protein
MALLVRFLRVTMVALSVPRPAMPLLGRQVMLFPAAAMPMVLAAAMPALGAVFRPCPVGTEFSSPIVDGLTPRIAIVAISVPPGAVSGTVGAPWLRQAAAFGDMPCVERMIGVDGDLPTDRFLDVTQESPLLRIAE